MFRSRTEEILRQRLYQLFRRETPMTLRFGELYANEAFPLRVNGIQWRNYVYLRALYADPLTDLNGQFRDINASFYRYDQNFIFFFENQFHCRLTYTTIARFIQIGWIQHKCIV